MYLRSNHTSQRLGSWENNPEQIIEAARTQEDYANLVEWATSPMKALAKRGARYLAYPEDISETRRIEAILTKLLRQHGLIK